MADPFSIVAGAVQLLSMASDASQSIARFINTCREAGSDLLVVRREVSALSQILQCLKSNIEANNGAEILGPLSTQIQPIICDCGRILGLICGVVESHSGRSGALKWASGGKETIRGLKETLNAHKGALQLTVEIFSLAAIQGVRADTTAIRGDMTLLRVGYEEIIARITDLQSRLPRRTRDNRTTVVLQQYLDNLTTYAGSEVGDDHNSDGDQCPDTINSSSSATDNTGMSQTALHSPQTSIASQGRRPYGPFATMSAFNVPLQQLTASNRQHPPPRASPSGGASYISGSSGIWKLVKGVKLWGVMQAFKEDSDEKAMCHPIARHPPESQEADVVEKQVRHHGMILTLLNHPHIARLLEVVITSDHWYFLYENATASLHDMLAHKGKLNESQARHVGTQAASALDYCHRNNISLDGSLSLSNVFISEHMNVKLTGFGSAKLYRPKFFKGHTLCHTAIELVDATCYTAIGRDIQSFGILLYTMVCGKEPFSGDRTRRKKGQVSYPGQLSEACVDLLSRMLTMVSIRRATMAEIMRHPWLTNSSGITIENHLPTRNGLLLPLDDATVRETKRVVDRMRLGSLGGKSEETIRVELARILGSGKYLRGLRRSWTHDEDRGKPPTPDSGANVRIAKELEPGLDPFNAFDPLISIYYLVREKMERDRVSSVQPPGLPPSPAASIVSGVATRVSSAGSISIPISSSNKEGTSLKFVDKFAGRLTGRLRWKSSKRAQLRPDWASEISFSDSRSNRSWPSISGTESGDDEWYRLAGKDQKSKKWWPWKRKEGQKGSFDGPAIPRSYSDSPASVAFTGFRTDSTTSNESAGNSWLERLKKKHSKKQNSIIGYGSDGGSLDSDGASMRMNSGVNRLGGLGRN